ncbi:Uncharacterised protein [Serratia plymuthica]|nr:Uncharacterised protein [Serratia plymuthica]
MISPYGCHKCAAHIDPFGSDNVIALASANLDSQRRPNHGIAVTDHVRHIVRTNEQFSRHTNVNVGIQTNGLVFVVLGKAAHIPLCLFPILLKARLIFKTNAVKITAPPADGAANQPTLRRINGQIPRWHSDVVVKAAGNQRPVRIAIDKINNHFMPDTWNVNPAEIIPRPGLADSQPARVRLAVFTVAIPKETHFYPAVFIRPDLLPRRTNDNGSLRTAGFGLIHTHRMAVNFSGRLNGKIALVAEFIPRCQLVYFLYDQVTA